MLRRHWLVGIFCASLGTSIGCQGSFESADVNDANGASNAPGSPSLRALRWDIWGRRLTGTGGTTGVSSGAAGAAPVGTGGATAGQSGGTSGTVSPAKGGATGNQSGGTSGTVSPATGGVSGGQSGVTSGTGGTPPASGTGGAAVTSTGGSGTCGNGKLDPGEFCDGSSMQSAGCAQLGFSGGSLACSSTCQFNVSSCTGGTIKPTISASRTSCVAPCGVNFDATGTSGLAGGDYDNANWYWDFNDPTSPHKATVGFVVGHVFDSPGTYHVQTMVRDTAGSVGATTTTITVSAMGGTTYYVAANGNDSNNGTSTATPFLTFDHAFKFKGTNVRLLFRNGDTFTMDPAGYTLTVAGPFVIGGYSDPAAPSSTAPVFAITASGGFSGLFGPNGPDIKLVGLHLTNPGNGIFNMIALSNASNFLMENVEMEGYGGVTSSSIGVDVDTASSNVFLVDCNFHDFSGYGVYNAGSTGATLIGNQLMNFTGTDHGFRWSFGTNSYAGNNTIIPATTSNSTFDCMVARGDGNTKTVFVNNVCARDMGAAPTNTMSVEHISHVLFEGNYVYSNTSPTDTSAQGFNIGSQHVVIRNNRIETPYCIAVQGPPLLTANYVDYIYIYNNTCYYPGAAGHLTDTMAFLQRGGSTGTNFFLRNNIWYQGGTPGTNSLIQTDGQGSTTEDHNLAYAPGVSGKWAAAPSGTGDIVADPKFVSNGSDYHLQAGSPALNAGAADAVYGDASSVLRPNSTGWDIGAYQYSP